ncbi:MAG: tetratricopeptide repeat protein [Chloroflexi bacterium]|nr:tetratricopeptide repeat protein [Chloroflexota bacterium]
MTDKLSFTQLVTQVLMMANHPLTLVEIIARVEMIRPVDTRNPRTTIRGAISSVRQATTLGGRPARYTWWPRHLANNAFRQSLADSDLEKGTLVLGREVWRAFWTGFYDNSSRSRGKVSLALDGGPVLQTRVQHLVHMEPVWGLPATPALANWYRQQGAAPEDDVIVHVLDVEAHRYALSVARRAERDEEAVAARNQSLADIAEKVLRTGRMDMPGSYLIPRLIAHGAYHDPLPPDPWEKVLRRDLRFVVGEHSIDLAEKAVDSLEREMQVPPDMDSLPRPRGNRHKARSDEARQAWGQYLFDRGMDHRWVDWPWAAEAYYREALRVDPSHADAWVHLGNVRFDEEELDEALTHYKRGQAAAEVRVIGDPTCYPHPFWLDLNSRPFMRALHGRGLCLWRLRRTDEARQVFVWMLELNPNDNQGARFLLHDIDEGLSWDESMAKEDAWQKEHAEAFRLARIWGSQPNDVVH